MKYNEDFFTARRYSDALKVTAQDAEWMQLDALDALTGGDAKGALDLDDGLDIPGKLAKWQKAATDNDWTQVFTPEYREALAHKDDEAWMVEKARAWEKKSAGTDIAGVAARMQWDADENVLASEPEEDRERFEKFRTAWKTFNRQSSGGRASQEMESLKGADDEYRSAVELVRAESEWAEKYYQRLKDKALSRNYLADLEAKNMPVLLQSVKAGLSEEAGSILDSAAANGYRWDDSRWSDFQKLSNEEKAVVAGAITAMRPPEEWGFVKQAGRKFWDMASNVLFDAPWDTMVATSAWFTDRDYQEASEERSYRRKLLERRFSDLGYLGNTAVEAVGIAGYGSAMWAGSALGKVAAGGTRLVGAARGASAVRTLNAAQRVGLGVQRATGTALYAIDNQRQYLTRIQDEGGDVNDVRVQLFSWATAVGSAMVESIQWETAFGGRGLTMAQADAYSHVVHSLFGKMAERYGIRSVAGMTGREAARTIGMEMLKSTFFESAEEAIQQTMEEVAVQVGTGRDVNLGAAMAQGAGAFIQSLGPMAMTMVVGTPVRAYRGARNPSYSAEDQQTLLNAGERIVDWMKNGKWGADRTEEQTGAERAVQTAFSHWARSESDRDALDRIMRMGFSRDDATRMDSVFRAIRNEAARLSPADLGASLLPEGLEAESATDVIARSGRQGRTATVTRNADGSDRIETTIKTEDGREIKLVENIRRKAMKPIDIVGGTVEAARNYIQSIVTNEEESVARAGQKILGNLTLEQGAASQEVREKFQQLVAALNLRESGGAKLKGTKAGEDGRVNEVEVDIALEPNAFRGTVRHEHVHAIQEVAKAALGLTDEQAKALAESARGLVAHGDNERWNEEAAPIAAQFVRDGATGPVGEILQWATDRFRAMVGLERREKAAKNAVDWFLAAMRTGRFGSLANLDVYSESAANDLLDSLVPDTEAKTEEKTAADGETSEKTEAPSEEGEEADAPEPTETPEKPGADDTRPSFVKSLFRIHEPITKEQMASLFRASGGRLTTELVWREGYRWNETSGTWQFVQDLAGKLDERDLPQTPYMGADGEMHEPAEARHQITAAPEAISSAADQMERDGASREDVWKKLGAYRGVDGKWRVEVNDLKWKDGGEQKLRDFFSGKKRTEKKGDRPYAKYGPDNLPRPTDPFANDHHVWDTVEAEAVNRVYNRFVKKLDEATRTGVPWVIEGVDVVNNYDAAKIFDENGDVTPVGEGILEEWDELLEEDEVINEWMEQGILGPDVGVKAWILFGYRLDQGPELGEDAYRAAAIDDPWEAWRELRSLKSAETPVSLKLGDIVDGEILRAVPELADAVIGVSTPGSGEAGHYSPTDGSIHILAGMDSDETLNTLAHEVQHAIQDRFRLVGGGNEEYAGGLRPDRKEAMKYEDRLSRRLDRLYAKWGLPDIHSRILQDAYAELDKISEDAASGKISRGDAMKRRRDVRLKESRDWRRAVDDLDKSGEFRRLEKELERARNVVALSVADNLELYMKLGGEVEARMVERRSHMTQAQRRREPPWVTQSKMGYPESGQILHDFGALRESLVGQRGIGDERYQVSPDFAMDGTVVDALPAHLREDGRAIVAERADTPAWMADPDGTPTDLSERDWLRREAERAHDATRYQTSLGVPYQGSKGRIAARLVDELPAGERFVDLFSGGGAMTHAAILSGKYNSFRMNDADGVGQELFLQGLRGEWDGYSRESMTPEEFAQIRGTPEALPWSFNGLGRNLMHGYEAERKRRQNVARVQRLGVLRDDADRVEASRTDYRDVELRPGDVVYADPPYAGTDSLAYGAAKEFDAKAFSDWALAQDVPIYVSEYAMPEGWTEIASVPARAMRGGRTTERLFVQSKFADAHRNAGGSRYSVTPHGVQKQAGVAYPDASSEIVRFSIGSKRREEYKGLLERKRPDLEADEVLAELDKFNDPKKEKIALHWVVRGTIRLPEDSYKVEDALEVAAKAKVDPFSFDSPDAMMEANKDARPNAKRIDPDSVKEFSDRMDEGAGVVSYLVDNSSDGQAAVRRIIDTHWGEDANPWCLAANKQTENFAYDPWFYWKEYSGTPKRIAFRNGRLLAFSASKSSDRIEWWDRMDSGFNGAIPTGSKPVPGDKWGRWRFTGIVDGKEQFIAPGWYERRLSNGGYIQWDDNGYVRDKRTPEGERVAFSDGVPTSYEYDGWEIGWDWMRDRTATSVLFSKPGSGKPYFEWNYRDPEHFVWGGRTYEIAKTKSAKALAAYREAMELEQTVFRRELQPSHSEARDRMDARAGNDRRYQISGAVGAEALGIRGLADAEAMERSGADRLAVWRETGWWRGRDGMWRVEIPDFELVPDAVRLLLANGSARLADLIPADSAILRAYPGIGTLRIDLREGTGGTNYGFKIEIGRNLIARDLRSTLLHEVQHTIQDIEGFAKGASFDQQINLHANREADEALHVAWPEYQSAAEETREALAKYARKVAIDWLEGLHEATIDEQGRIKYPYLTLDGKPDKDSIPRWNGRMLRSLGDVEKAVRKALDKADAWDIKRLVEDGDPSGVFFGFGADDLAWFIGDVESGSYADRVPPGWMERIAKDYGEIVGPAREKLLDASRRVDEIGKVQNRAFAEGEKAYLNAGGEAEARLVQKRMAMTPEERAVRPPWMDFDVAESEQIVRGVEQSLPKSVTDSKSFDGVDEDTAAPRFSIATYENGGRETLEKWLLSQTRGKKATLSKEDASDILVQTDYIAGIARKFAKDKHLAAFSNWSEARVELDSEGRPYFGVVRTNGDYAMNIDFSTVCKKRRPMDRIFARLVRDGVLTGANVDELSGEAVAGIQRILKAHGLEVACALCFVDAKRYRLGDVAKRFADGGTTSEGKRFAGWNNIVAAQVAGGKKWADRVKNAKGKKDFESRCVRAIDADPSLRVRVDGSQLISSEGMDRLARENPGIYELWRSYGGTSHAKDSHWDTPYNNDIIRPFASRVNDRRQTFKPEDAFAVGGVRLQSFSDFVGRMFFDYVQMFAELAGKRLPLHTYTKEPNFVKLFRLTKAKINMSLVPAVVDNGVAPGLDPRGNYAWADETFPPNDAWKLRKLGSNVGTIAVGVSDRHITKLLRDPKIDQVIPYHKSGINPVVAAIRRISFFQDYTDEQNTRNQDGSKYEGAEHFDFYGSLARTQDPRVTADEYLAWCDERGLIPKFDRFRGEKNYYKLLADFRLYDDAGNYAPQEAVEQKYPDDLGKLVLEALKFDQKAEDAYLENENQIVREIEREILPRRSVAEQDTRHALAPSYSLWNDGGPRFSGDDYLVGIAATAILAGKEEGLEGKLSEVARGLQSEITPADAIATARSLLNGEARERGAALVREGRPKDAAEMFAGVAMRNAADKHVMRAMQAGAKTALRGARDQARALAAILREETGIDAGELTNMTGVDWGRVLHTRLSEEEAPAPAQTADEALEGVGEAGDEVLPEPDDGEYVGEDQLDTMEPDDPRRVTAEARLREIREKTRRVLDAVKAKVEERRKEREAEQAEEPEDEDRSGRGGDGEDGETGGEGGEEESAEQTPRQFTIADALAILKDEDIDFSDGETVAAFLRVLVGDGIRAQENGGAEPPPLSEEEERRFWRNPTVVKQYALSMKNVLQDWARGMLDHGSYTYSSVMRIAQELSHWESATSIERTCASLVSRISHDSIRQTARQIAKETRDYLEKAVGKARFSELDPDFTRKVMGAVQKEAKYIRRVLMMSDGEIKRALEGWTDAAGRRHRGLDEILEQRKSAYAAAGAGEDAYLGDNDYRWAARRKAIIEEYGHFLDLLPGEAREKAAAIREWIDLGVSEFAVRMAQKRTMYETDRATVIAAARRTHADGTDFVYEKQKTKLDRLLEVPLNVLEQELRDFFKYATGADAERAKELIDRYCHRVAEATQTYEVLKQDGSIALENAAKAVFGSRRALSDWMLRLSQPLPEEQAARLCRSGRRTMTYGQALHLYGYLCQTDNETYRENIERYGRQDQRALLESEVLSAEDLKMVAQLRAIYSDRRAELSAAKERITGIGFGTPSPFYLPVEIDTGETSGIRDTRRGGAGVQLMPAVFSDRVRHERDVDETADILSVYISRLDQSARVIAYGDLSIDLLHVFGAKDVKDALVRYHGKEAEQYFSDHIVDILSGEPSKTVGAGDNMSWIAGKAMNIGTYIALWGNLNTMLKQMVSQYATSLRRRPGDVSVTSDLLRVVKDPRAWLEAANELKASPGYRARYGAGGIMDEVARVVSGGGGLTFVNRIAQAGMTPIQFGDAVGGMLVAVGMYQRVRDHYLETNPDATYDQACKYAAVEAMRSVEQTQQSSQTENKPYYARRGSMGHRLLMMFASAASLQNSWEALTRREWLAAADPHNDRNFVQALAANFTDEEARRRFCKYAQTVVINHVVVPLLMEAASKLFSALLGDAPPPPEEELKNIAILILLGQFGRMAFWGSLVDYGLRKSIGENPRSTAPSIFSTFERLASNVASLATDLLDGDMDDALDDLDRTMKTAVPPYRHVRKAIDNYSD